MYRIERTDFGFKLIFGGSITDAEMHDWASEIRQQLKAVRPGFGVLVDMRELKPLTEKAQHTMVETQREVKQAGMTRSAVLLSSKIVALQFERLAKESGLHQWERYVDGVSDAMAVNSALEWVRAGTGPLAAR